MNGTRPSTGPFRIQGSTHALVCNDRHALGPTVANLFAGQSITITDLASGMVIFEGRSDACVLPGPGLSPTQDMSSLLGAPAGVEVVPSSGVVLPPMPASVIVRRPPAGKPGDGPQAGGTRPRSGPHAAKSPRRNAPASEPRRGPSPILYILAGLAGVLVIGVFTVLMRAPEGGAGARDGHHGDRGETPGTDSGAGIADGRSAGASAAAGNGQPPVPGAAAPENGARAAGANTDPFARDLVLRYAFDERSGTDVHDAGPRGLHAVMNGTWTHGRTTGALELSGEGQYVSLPDALFTGLTQLTIATWVEIGPGTIPVFARIFDFGSAMRINMYLTPLDNAGQLRFATTRDGTDGEQRTTAPALVTGAWVHLVVTLGDQVATVYVDGRAVGASVANVLRPLDIEPTTHNWLGRSQYGFDPFMHIRFDDFRIYARALKAHEVAALMRLP
jgi:hypothetical protein